MTPGPLGRRAAQAGKIVAVTVNPKRAAVLALHWQVNVIKPEGFFGSLLKVATAGCLTAEQALILLRRPSSDVVAS